MKINNIRYTPILSAVTINTLCSALAYASLNVEINAEPETFSDVGDVITIEYTITNTDDTPHTNIFVTNEETGTVCEVGLLSPSFTATCTAVKIVNELDVDIGSFTIESQISSDQTPEPLSPLIGVIAGDDAPGGDISIAASAVPSEISRVGERIDVTYVIANESDMLLQNVQVTDSVIGTVCRIGSLYTGISTTCVGVHFVTEEEFNTDRQVVFNSEVTADGVSGSVSTSLTVARDGGSDTDSILTATATADPEFISNLGSVDINYEVANIGESTLTNVRIASPQIADPVCIIPSLSAGITASCAGVFQVTEDFGETLDVSATVTSDQDSVGVPVTVTLINEAPIVPDIFPPIIDPLFPDDGGSLVPTFDIVYDVNDEDDFFFAFTGVNEESITVTINGGEIAADVFYVGRILTLKPTPEWPTGVIDVEISAADNNGNSSTRSFSYTVDPSQTN